MTRRKTNENLADMAGSAEADHELQMARSQLYKIAQYAIKLHEMTKQITDPQGLEPWQSAKLTKASDYLSAVYHNLEYNLKYKPNGEPAGELGAEAGEIAVGETKKKYGKMKETSDPYMQDLRKRLKLAEKAESQAQQQAAGIALKHKREGTKPKEGTASAEMMSMSKDELEKIAGTKHKGLPDKKESTNEAGRGPGQGRRGYNNNLPSAAAQARKAQLKKQADKEKEKKTNEGRRGGKGMAAAGRASSGWGGMGRADRDSFKRREMEKELGHETKPKRQAPAQSGPVYLMIDGKVWKKDGQPVEFKDKQHASNVGRKILAKNPGKDIKMTSNPNPK